MTIRLILLTFIALTANFSGGRAEEPAPYSASLSGPLGLNIVPSARMDKSGTLSAGVATMDPYLHGYIGVQMTAPLYINIRQSAEVSSLNGKADRLYPGVDMKLRLLEESKYRPEIAVGLQSMIGHKRMAGEYLALSKRYKSFDFTGGIGWGRYGTAGHFNNPLKALSGHFGNARNYDDNLAASPEEWFTGDKIGLFGGVEYFTPMQGLSLKLDVGADRYSAESAAGNYKAPAPWALGFNFRPVSGWFDAGVAMMGMDKIMARFTLRTHPSNWNVGHAKQSASRPLRPYRTGMALPNQMQRAAHGDGALLYNARTEGRAALASLDLNAYPSAPEQIALAATHMANHAGREIESLSIRPTKYRLKGPRITLNRRDLESALARKQGSADEIWMNADFDTAASSEEPTSPFMLSQFKTEKFSFILDNQFSLAEEDSGALYRSSLIGKLELPKYLGFIHTGSALRLNLADNLERLEEYRTPSFLPVRSNVADFARSRISLDRSYATFTHSFSPELHGAISAGYLEEMYGGMGGEILYRPFGKRFALGAESWAVIKRDPATALHMGFTPDSLITGHLNSWYSFPERNITLKAQIGRYLAEDIGATFTIEKEFLNGAKLQAFTTLTDGADISVFGGTTHAYNGIRLSVPLGNKKYLPEGSEMRVSAAPFGRDYGQALDKPFDLYKETDALSYEHLARYWHEMTE